MVVRNCDVAAEEAMTRRNWLLQLQWLVMLFLIQSICQLTPAVQVNDVEDNDHQKMPEFPARTGWTHRNSSVTKYAYIHTYMHTCIITYIHCDTHTHIHAHI